MHPTAERFQERLRELGLDAEVQELADSTRTAKEAAAAVGVEVGQIVKSLVFVDDSGPVLCLCAGDRRGGRGEPRAGGGTRASSARTCVRPTATKCERRPATRSAAFRPSGTTGRSPPSWTPR